MTLETEKKKKKINNNNKAVMKQIIFDLYTYYI